MASCRQGFLCPSSFSSTTSNQDVGDDDISEADEASTKHFSLPLVNCGMIGRVSNDQGRS